MAAADTRKSTSSNRLAAVEPLVLPIFGVVLIGVCVAFALGGGDGATATASHILVKHESTCSELMRELHDGADFAQMAAAFSTCPSGKRAGGSLGTFKRGRMVPAFDAVIFDPKSKVGDVLGPIKTQFGFHLIKIHSREMPESTALGA